MPSKSSVNTILVKTSQEAGKNYEEGKCDGAITPGMNVVMSGETPMSGLYSVKAGGSDQVGTGTIVTTNEAPVRVAIEDALQGGTIDDAYADDEQCRYWIAEPGEILQVLVRSGETVLIGDGLSAFTTGFGAHAGKWYVDATNPAVEALENSGGALAADTHMRARVL